MQIHWAQAPLQLHRLLFNATQTHHQTFAVVQTRWTFIHYWSSTFTPVENTTVGGRRDLHHIRIVRLLLGTFDVILNSNAVGDGNECGAYKEKYVEFHFANDSLLNFSSASQKPQKRVSIVSIPLLFLAEYLFLSARYVLSGNAFILQYNDWWYVDGAQSVRYTKCRNIGVYVCMYIYIQVYII